MGPDEKTKDKREPEQIILPFMEDVKYQKKSDEQEDKEEEKNEAVRLGQ